MQPADTPLPNPTPKGVSCYPRAGANPKPEELESCAVKYDAELKAMGFDLRKWTDKAVRGGRVPAHRRASSALHVHWSHRRHSAPP